MVYRQRKGKRRRKNDGIDPDSLSQMADPRGIPGGKYHKTRLFPEKTMRILGYYIHERTRIGHESAIRERARIRHERFVRERAPVRPRNGYLATDIYTLLINKGNIGIN